MAPAAAPREEHRKGIDELLGGSDPERGRRAMEAMFKMRKLDLAALRAAADVAPA